MNLVASDHPLLFIEASQNHVLVPLICILISFRLR